MPSNVQPTGSSEGTAVDEYWLRYTFGLATAALDLDDQPFAAVLVGNGKALIEAVNERQRTRDCTAHAERLVCAEASVRWGWDYELLSCFTLYSSTEPCLMCAGAFAWSGLRRLVFGISQTEMAGLFPGADPPRFPQPWSARELLARTYPAVEVVGPLLTEEAKAPHRLWFERLNIRPA